MQVIIIFIFILLFLSSLTIKDKLANSLLIIYIIWWMSLLFISTFNFFGLNQVSKTAYSLLLLNVIMFTIGYLISCRKNKSSDYLNLKNSISIISDNLSKKQLFMLPISLLTILLGYYAFKYINILNNNGVSDSRVLRFWVGELFGTTFEIMFYNYFIESIAYFIIFIIAFRLILGKINRIFLYLAIMYFIFYSIIGAGRNSIIEFGFYIILLFVIKAIIYNKCFPLKCKIGFRKPKKKIISTIIILFLLYCIAVYITSVRYGLLELTFNNFKIGNNNFMEQIAIYLLGPFRAFDFAIHNLDKYLGFNFGRLTFGGIDEFLGNFIRLINPDYHIMNNDAAALTVSNISIGRNIEFNALYTCVFNYYFDFSVAGVILFPFLYGFLYHRLLLNFEFHPNVYSLFMVIYVATSTLTSVLVWRFTAPAAVAVLFGAYFLSSKIKMNLFHSKKFSSEVY